MERQIDWESGFADGSKQTFWEVISVVDGWLEQNLPPSELRDRLYLYAKQNAITLPEKVND